ncbi:DUF599 family protein [Alsobacter sp. SYSU M60028]|uniref:DUF599 family protein n=1 Tax=Alsobacter ponti TaxID=2962936 RepID=A0ABT1LC02_9HYPH|nr:DUF599 family protein [Alsobacter ponti]MCP8939032.1 DUF599 family protein [Alsobacter ponti]
MPDLTLLDAVALAFFILCWVAYHRVLESRRLGPRSLNGMMHAERLRWMERMIVREPRIVDTQIMGSLQNGTAFFASTSLFAIGGSLALLRGAEDVQRVFTDMPFAVQSTRAMWEVKTIGLTVIFVYAFFKFAWSYRLFNYAAILLGATPPPSSADTPEGRLHVLKTTRMTTAAGAHFNRGQRAFFFALGYLGWFLGPGAFLATTAGVLAVMASRQFRSNGYRALVLREGDDAGA